MNDVLGILVTLFSFFIAIKTAKIISGNKSFSFLSNRSERNVTIDGLRGFLALSVLFHHFVITWYWRADGDWIGRIPQDYFQNYGEVGVALFFMITGYLFISKIMRQNNHVNWYKLYESRFFRIFPLYLFVLAIITFAVFHGTDFEMNVDFYSLMKQYIKWGMFHGGVINDFVHTQKVIAGVDWTLKYEWIFYMLLPVVAAILAKFGKKGAISLFVISIVLYLLPVKIYSVSTIYFILFAFGALVAYLSKIVNISKSIVKSTCFSIITAILIMVSLFYPNTLDLFHIVIISTLFILVVMGNDLFGLFSMKSSVLLGEISYSIYLLHGAVLYFSFTAFGAVDVGSYELTEFLAYMPLIAAVVVIVSSITFILIERPGIEMGHKYYLSNMIEKFSIIAGKRIAAV